MSGPELYAPFGALSGRFGACSTQTLQGLVVSVTNVLVLSLLFGFDILANLGLVTCSTISTACEFDRWILVLILIFL